MAKMSVSGIVYTQAFGPRTPGKVDPNTFHWGADFGPPKRGQTGVPLFAIFAGKVTRLRDQYGALGVRVGDRKTEAIEFWHLARYAKNLGMFVSEGDEVGEMGTTGRSTGIHVHVEHWVKGKRIDPLPFINKQAKKSVAPGDGDTDAPEEDDMALTPEQAAALDWLGAEDRRKALDSMVSQVKQLWDRRAIIDELGRDVNALEWLAGRQAQEDVEAYQLAQVWARLGIIDRLGTSASAADIAAEVASKLDIPGIGPEQVQAIAKAVADEQAKRLAS
ncbi:hypothetical protein L332_03670 [Agrococcus pavilionensis RW1]|uniref:M23ase beta-sheet core domain-containing protein n=1 Tax=Agrococcus pavilionensis RW1 TaxID=1330458 RepID=U1MSA9_9MICO|nr:M23 family metallopeptidase [Agrococcus pavilionensis]ERG63550.1 hypothetical protein L332_03670 [Agrococcus pavilionensis RW1]